MLHVILLSVLLTGTNGEKAAPAPTTTNPTDTTAKQQQQQTKKSSKIDPPKTQKKEAEPVSPKVHMVLLDGILG